MGWFCCGETLRIHEDSRALAPQPVDLSGSIFGKAMGMSLFHLHFSVESVQCPSFDAQQPCWLLHLLSHGCRICCEESRRLGTAAFGLPNAHRDCAHGRCGRVVRPFRDHVTHNACRGLPTTPSATWQTFPFFVVSGHRGFHWVARRFENVQLSSEMLVLQPQRHLFCCCSQCSAYSFSGTCTVFGLSTIATCLVTSSLV